METVAINWPIMIGEGILFSSMEASLASVEMSSKFSVINFCKDQETLQNAADALRGYLIIGCMWMIGTILVMYAQYGIAGAVTALVCNMIYVLWIHISYINSFKIAAEKYGLVEPYVFFKPN